MDFCCKNCNLYFGVIGVRIGMFGLFFGNMFVVEGFGLENFVCFVLVEFIDDMGNVGVVMFFGVVVGEGGDV